MLQNELNCCAMYDYNGIDLDNYSTKRVFQEIGCERERERFSFVIFSSARNHNRITELARFIKKHKLGETKLMNKRKNANTGRIIKAMMYGINQKNLRKWFIKNRENHDNTDENCYLCA